MLLGNGNGSFQPAVTTNVLNSGLGNGNAESVAVGDFNGDHLPDVALNTAGPAGPAVEVLLGKGDGSFQPNHQILSVGQTPLSVAAGDFDRNGALDLVTANSTSGTLSVLLGNGNGSFRPRIDLAVGGAPRAVAVGDFNGDGRLDVATAQQLTDTVSVLLGNGDGTFARPLVFAASGQNFTPESLAVGDVNGDGKLDLAIKSVSVLDSDAFQVGVLLGNGDGTFQAPLLGAAQPDGSGDLALGDFNNDGRMDAAVADQLGASSGNLSVFAGNGDGTFQSLIRLDLLTGGNDPEGVAAADLNGDGLVDLVAANTSSGTVGVLLNNSTRYRREDVTTLSTSTATAVFGQPVTLTATVTSAAGVPTGTVTFRDGTTVLGTARGQRRRPGHPRGVAGRRQPRADRLLRGHRQLRRQHLGGRGRDRQPRDDHGRPEVVGQPGRHRPGGDLHGHGGRRRPGGRHADRHGHVPGRQRGPGDRRGRRAAARATFTTSFAAAGGHAITAVYNGDPNFVGSSQSLTEQVNAATTGLQQGGFESPSVGSGFQYRPVGTPWTFSGSAGVAGNGSGFTAGNPNAPEGTQVGFLQGTGSFSQTVAGLAAGTYQLSFSAAQRANFQASRQDFRVLVDGVAVGTFTPSGTGYSNLTATVHGRCRNAHDHLPGAGQCRRRQHRLHRQRPLGPDPRGQSLRRRVRVAGGGQRVPVRPGRHPLGVHRQRRRGGQRQRLHRRKPQCPRGHPGRLPAGTGSFSQTVTGMAAGTYQLTFSAAQRANFQASRQDFQVLVDGVVVGTFTPSGTGYSSLTTDAFTVAAGVHRIMFQGLDSAGGDNTAFIDNVRLT